nr:SDR family oxidoreductase [Nodosilinea sp. LEGE 07298]
MPLERKILVVCAAAIARAVAQAMTEAWTGKCIELHGAADYSPNHVAAALGRDVQDNEVAGMVSYLASPEAAFVTGASLRMDSGLSA